jgi:hypothetical protein
MIEVAWLMITGLISGELLDLQLREILVESRRGLLEMVLACFSLE